jgi:hypothetical protein
VRLSPGRSSPGGGCCAGGLVGDVGDEHPIVNITNAISSEPDRGAVGRVIGTNPEL